MLVVLGMSIVRLSDPNTWRSLAADKDQTPIRKTDDGAGNGGVAPKPTGPTDADPEQADAVREEFQAVTDGTTRLGVEEMEIYNRLVFWVKNQSFASLWQRAAKRLAYTYLYDDAKKHRGQLAALDIEVRLVREAGKNRDGVALYEAWASTEESRGRLYDLIVVDFPPPIPEGEFIREKARFAGYFLKLQGYQPATAKPGQRPEKAPLLIGRLEWAPAAAPLVDNTSELFWGMISLAVVGLAFIVWFIFFQPRRRRSAASTRVSASPTGEVIPIDVWLERGNLAAEEDEDRLQ